MGGRSSKDALKDARRRAEERVGTLQVSGRYHRLPRKLSDDYSLTETVLGTGFGGSVFLATSRRPDRQGRTSRFAVKSIKLHHKASRRTLAAEVEVFLSVDHPHVCRLLDVYESEKSLDLVMECLEGGELYQRVNAGKFAEKDAADAAYQMLLAIRYLHNLGIVHRDIKLENFLYTEVGSNHLKLIDFGFSKAWDPEQKKMKLSCGTICYVAPEVILQSYTNMCDMWSLGVVVFLLLVGYMPFPVLPNIEETELNILNGRFKYDARKWKGVSKSSFDFVSKLLQRDPDQRMTAEQALAHPWIAEREQFPSGTESAGLDASVVHSLAEYSRASKFRRTCMQVMAWSLNNAEMAEVREAFMELDVQKTGAIQLHQLKSVLEERFNICDEETRKIFEALDSSNNEEVGYSEFLAAMMSSRIQVHEDLVRAAFQRYDEDDSGYISVENLRQVLTESLDSPETAEEMLSGVSVFAGAEQRVSFDAFIEYLTGGEADESHKRAVGFVIDKQMSRMSSSELMRVAPTLRHCPLTPKGLNRAKSTPFMMVEDSSDDEAKKEIPMSPFLTTPNPVKQTKVPSLVDTTEAAANAKQLEEVPESPPPTVPTPAVKGEVKSSVCAIL